MSHYLRFAVMIVVATIIMYPLMYFNTYSADHIFYSETRLYMTLLMGASMAVIMLFFMQNMLDDQRKNFIIIAASIGVFGLSIYLVRSQRVVDDVSWMRAMIPHHSIAILTSERAEIKDPRVRKLADKIISSQRREIEEMKGYIAEIEGDAPLARDATLPLSH